MASGDGGVPLYFRAVSLARFRSRWEAFSRGIPLIAHCLVTSSSVSLSGSDGSISAASSSRSLRFDGVVREPPFLGAFRVNEVGILGILFFRGEQGMELGVRGLDGNNRFFWDPFQCAYGRHYQRQHRVVFPLPHYPVIRRRFWTSWASSLYFLSIMLLRIDWPLMMDFAIVWMGSSSSRSPGVGWGGRICGSFMSGSHRDFSITGGRLRMPGMCSLVGSNVGVLGALAFLNAH
ncbi:unnamed protein product [Peniophora sp. CBMAI 1063]|nr:unnamed protein product [Peniophora sp. CBMAI 1063]